MDKELYTLKQVRQKINIPTYTLRKFCDKGLIRGVRRRGGYRVFNEEQIEQARTLNRLIQCGMSWNDLRTYMELERAGDQTVAQRKAMLETKKRQLWQEIEDKQACIDFIERKEEIFNQILAEN